MNGGAGDKQGERNHSNRKRGGEESGQCRKLDESGRLEQVDNVRRKQMAGEGKKRR